MDKYVDEYQLISGCKLRSRKCQEMLFKKYYGYAMSIGFTYLSTHDDVLEIVNDSFLKVFDAIDQYQHNRPFKYWFRRIVINTTIDYYRKKRKYLLVDSYSSLEFQEECILPHILHTLNAEDIFYIINKLPVLHRLVFNLFEIEGYSHREIARELKISEISSRTYLVRAKKALREMIVKY